jgi:hypothetical protein
LIQAEDLVATDHLRQGTRSIAEQVLELGEELATRLRRRVCLAQAGICRTEEKVFRDLLAFASEFAPSG